MRIAEFLADPERWTQRALARDASGTCVRPLAPEACRWCLVGALIVCYPDDRERWEVVEKLMHAVFGASGMSLTFWNDSPDRTHAEILALVTEEDV